MKLLLTFIIVALLAVGGFFLVNYFFKNDLSDPQDTTNPASSSADIQNVEDLTVLAENLDTPWAIAFLPTGGMLVTERGGAVRLITADGELQNAPVGEITNASEVGEGGLLGIALHPDFASNNYVYLYYTYSSNSANTLNRVVRMTWRNNRLTGEQTILDRIPGASNHNGGRIRFGPDGNLYIGTGDAQEPSEAQNTRSLAGKILRVTPEGRPVPGNPFTNEVYSYGHRNVQGIAFDSEGRLWATEHGRSGAASGLDEINLIESGRNYGWPEIEGNETASGMVTPKKNSGAITTWAPGGGDFVDGSFFFAGLRGVTLYEAVIENENVTEVKEHFSGEYGRLREVITGPDGMLYITTSNRDGRGRPGTTDDRVIRVNPRAL